ncbi:MAG: hypothetical protein CMJ49_04865 [Planctomycetaceae bacterium]|nr:hypothetical protein [Planctomycetaceae bacterium]
MIGYDVTEFPLGMEASVAITAMKVLDDKIFGRSGWPVMGLFSYDMTDGTCVDYGLVTEAYPKMCYLHGMVALPNGSIFVGETDGNRPHVYRMDPK